VLFAAASLRHNTIASAKHGIDPAFFMEAPDAALKRSAALVLACFNHVNSKKRLNHALRGPNQ
jgi:hypothetical protein